MTVGEKIKTFRTIRGISQNMLGELAGIDGTTIRKYIDTHTQSISNL